MTIYNSLLYDICVSVTFFETYVFGEVELEKNIFYFLSENF